MPAKTDGFVAKLSADGTHLIYCNSSLPRLLGRQERWSRFSSSVAANGLGEVVQKCYAFAEGRFA